MQKKRLLKLADFLDTVPREAFDIDFFIKSSADKPEGAKPGDCGFAGCAIGWAAHAKLVPGLSIADGGFVVFKQRGKGTVKWGLSSAMAAYALAPDQADFLFMPSAYEDSTPNPTPKQVAERIRKFVETGSI